MMKNLNIASMLKLSITRTSDFLLAQPPTVAYGSVYLPNFYFLGMSFRNFSKMPHVRIPSHKPITSWRHSWQIDNTEIRTLVSSSGRKRSYYSATLLKKGFKATKFNIFNVMSLQDVAGHSCSYCQFPSLSANSQDLLGQDFVSWGPWTSRKFIYGFQVVPEYQININIYIRYTALVAINAKKWKQIHSATAWKKTHPATTYSVDREASLDLLLGLCLQFKRESSISARAPSFATP